MRQRKFKPTPSPAGCKGTRPATGEASASSTGGGGWSGGKGGAGGGAPGETAGTLPTLPATEAAPEAADELEALSVDDESEPESDMLGSGDGPSESLSFGRWRARARRLCKAGLPTGKASPSLPAS
eukprot:1117777-Alexandrium_andersonii.AAC.1